MHSHRRCEYEKPNPENYRRPVDLSASTASRRANAFTVDPNRESAYYAETEVASRDVYIRALSNGLRRNQGYSGARYEARGTGPLGAPTGTIYFTAEGGALINGQASAAFSGFKRAALFSIEWDRITRGWLVQLMTGDMAPAAAVANLTAAPTMADYNGLLAKLRTAGLLLA
jgi:hypothetical protein